MYTVIVILIVIAAVLLCGIVFIQESKGGGLASGFADNNALLGVRKTTDFVEKATWSLIGTIVFLCVISVFFHPTSDSASGSVLEMQSATEQATNAVNVPSVPQTSSTQTSAPADSVE